MIYKVEYPKVADRIVYDIYDERITVLVIQAESHYNDK